MPIRNKRIETLAAEVLTVSNISEPPAPVEALAEKHGLQVRFQPLESDLSGFLYRTTERAIIGVNSFHSEVRQRFTIAHELGHFLLHQYDTLHVDRAVFARFRNTVSSQSTDPDEIEANRFGAALLMPHAWITQDLERAGAMDLLDEEFLVRLARRYNVSVQALTIRLINLGYIEE